MATYDFARFMPSESAFSNPGEVNQAYRAQAMEKATTASELERFYATLEETSREFDTEAAFKEKSLAQQQGQFEATLGEQKDEFGKTLAQRRDEYSGTLNERIREFTETHELDTERFQFEKEMGPKYLDLQSRVYQSQSRGQDFGMGMDVLGFVGGGGLSDVWGGVTDFFGGLF
jgi:hypothetical protein